MYTLPKMSHSLYYTLPYDSPLWSIKTGDLLLFSGRYPGSVWISHATRSSFSHVGMIIQDCENDGYFIFEAINGGVGVTLRPLFKILSLYDGMYRIRKLKEPLSTEQESRLIDFVRANVGKPFSHNLWEFGRLGTRLALSYLLPPKYQGPVMDKLIRRHKDSLHSNQYICSELIATAFEALGYKFENGYPDMFIPNDFESNSEWSIFRENCYGYGLYEKEQEIEHL